MVGRLGYQGGDTAGARAAAPALALASRHWRDAVANFAELTSRIWSHFEFRSHSHPQTSQNPSAVAARQHSESP